MLEAHAEDAFKRLLHRVDPQATLLRAWQLTGGVSAQTMALEIVRADGRVERMIVRRHGEVDLRHNPHIARDEFRLLEIAQAHGLAAPRPLFVDAARDLFPTPVVVIEYIEGNTDFEPADVAGYALQMATHLARIHTVLDAPDLAFLPRQDSGFGERPAQLDDSMQEGRIRDALEAAWPVAQVNASTLLHGDYWPGNILWRAGELVAVIDWEDAGVGDPLNDVANCRLELMMALGLDAVEAFTAAYRSLTTISFANLAYWDLCAALGPCGNLAGWGLDPDTEARMRAGHTAFVSQAIEALTTRDLE